MIRFMKHFLHDPELDGGDLKDASCEATKNVNLGEGDDRREVKIGTHLDGVEEEALIP